MAEAVVEEEAQTTKEGPEAEEESEEEVDFKTMIEAEKSIKFIEEDEDEIDLIDQSGKTDKKKKKPYRQVEYDPDLGVDIVRRRRKGDEDDWESF